MVYKKQRRYNEIADLQPRFKPNRKLMASVKTKRQIK